MTTDPDKMMRLTTRFPHATRLSYGLEIVMTKTKNLDAFGKEIGNVTMSKQTKVRTFPRPAAGVSANRR
jgi:hypothetical protein